MSSNEDILNYINKYFNNNNIETDDVLNGEIDKIFKELTKYKCSIPYEITTNVIINGVELDDINIINLVYLIPNLFRKCYSNDTVSVPSICPKFTFNTSITFYYPLLIDKDLIKSFLYFNCPSNIYNYTFNDGIKNVIKEKQEIIYKKKNTTSSSYTAEYEIFKIIYDKNSLINQLILFNKYINKSNYSVSNNKLISNFKILWDYTSSCITYTNSIDDSYIIGNNNKTDDVSEVTAKNLFDIKSIINNSGNNTKFFITIYNILSYAEEVYEDILTEIGYFMTSKEYCKKSYMNYNNIPELTSIYNNFYKNQVYSNSKDLSYNLSNNIIPQVLIYI